MPIKNELFQCTTHDEAKNLEIGLTHSFNFVLLKFELCLQLNREISRSSFLSSCYRQINGSTRRHKRRIGKKKKEKRERYYIITRKEIFALAGWTVTCKQELLDSVTAFCIFSNRIPRSFGSFDAISRIKVLETCSTSRYRGIPVAREAPLVSFVFRYRSLFVGTRSNQTLNVEIKYLKCGKFEGLKLIDRIYFNPFVFTDRVSRDFVSFVRRLRPETSFASVFSYVRLNVVPCERKGAKWFAFKNDK